MKITVSAPGKLMLFGEHAVVYDRPCIVTALDTRLSVTAETVQEGVHVETSGTDTRFVNAAIKIFIEQYPLSIGINIKTASDFSSQFGFGSSSAVTVCVLKALSEISGKKLDHKKLFDLAYKTVLDVQGKGSGFDVAAAIYGGTLYFVTGGKTIEPLPVSDMPLVIGYTGVKADTVTLMAAVSGKMKAQPERVGRIYDAITKLTEEAKVKIVEGDWERVGRLMDFNQDYLRDLGVSSEKLEALISAAKGAGALGAKLSGAGGGDCMIALASEHTRPQVEAAITEAGGQVIHPDPIGAAGVRVETDDQSELFVVVDADDRVIGYKTRYECHHDKTIIHRAVELFIFDSRGRILLQKRSLSKDTRPGYWSTSVGGHVGKNESDESAMLREMKEELGIEIPVTYHSRRVVHFPTETEMEALFTGTFDGPFHPHPHEVDEVKFFDKREIAFAVATNKLQLTEAALYNLKAIGVLS